MSARAITLLVCVGVLLLTGCPQQAAETADQVLLASDALTGAASDAPVGLNAYTEEERRLRVGAWLTSDLDGDGLTNGLEQEYGLDPEDPTDGPDIDGDGLINCVDDDIDGDGLLNESDPDIDGDLIPNSIDIDTDGDAVPDRVDFDTDGDGIRDRWDNDDDGDGEDDDEDDDEDDEDEDGDEDENGDGEENDGGDDQGNGGDDDDDEDAELRAKYVKMAEWVASVFGDDDDDEDDDDPEVHAEGILAETTDSTPEVTKFAVHVESLSNRAQSGDETAKKQLRRLLLSIDAGLLRPLDPNSEESRRLAKQLSERLGHDEVSTDEMLGYIDRLQEISKIYRDDDDASEAFDVLVKQVNEVEDSETRDPKSEIEDRLDNIERLGEEFDELGAPELSKAISDMAKILREISLDDKIDSLLDLGESIENPDVGNLVDGIEWLSKNIEGIETESDLDGVIDVLKSVPGINDGIDPEDLEEAEQQIEDDDNEEEEEPIPA